MSQSPAAVHLGERTLTTKHAIAQALAVGPMFSTALVLGSVSAGAGYHTVLSVILAAVGSLAVGYVIALFARRIAGAGAVFEYLGHVAHPKVALFFGGLFICAYVLLGAGGLYLGLGDLSQALWTDLVSAGTVPPWWVFALVTAGLVAWLTHRGVKLATGLMLGLAACSAVPMVFLAVAIIVQGGAGGSSADLTPFAGAGSLGSVLSGVLISILLFTGFEAAASLGEECRDPHKSIPRAVLATIGICAVFFVLMAYALSIGFGREAVEQGAWVNAGPTAVSEMARTYVGGWMATVVDVVIVLDSLALGLAMSVSVARMVFALGRVGALPAAFTTLSKHGTPALGNLAAPFGALVFLVLTPVAHLASHFVLPDGTPIFPSDQFATFVLTATAGGFAIQLIYLVLSLGAFRLLASTGGAWWQYLIVAVAAATPILGFYGALHPEPHDASNLNWVSFYVLVGSAIVCGIWAVAVSGVRRAQAAADESPELEVA
jgi:amino acid transporter